MKNAMRKTFTCFGAIALVLFLLIIFHAPVLSAYARFFSVSNATKGADAIVVLAGNIETRFPFALELYQQGYAPRILITEPRIYNETLRHVVGDEKTKAFAMLAFYGMQPPVDICPSRKGGATSTFDEAYDLRAYCQQHRLQRIIIVTDCHHTRRALHAFTKVFKGSQTTVEAMGAPNSIFNEQNWWRTDRGIEAYIIEPVKYILYLFTEKNVDLVKNY